MDTLRKSKSMINLNTGNFEKEQLLRLLTTNISNALKFSNLPDFNSGNVLLEMFAEILSIRDGSSKAEKLILLRSSNEKPVMQAVYYELKNELANIVPGQMIRVIGHLIGKTRRLRILKMNTIDIQQYAILNHRLKIFSHYEVPTK